MLLILNTNCACTRRDFKKKKKNIAMNAESYDVMSYEILNAWSSY